ncbi:hypothetical protein BY996DRAFT_1446779 [Phakopsora pachyrhizi]|nr:hypothetical protein BY996DRAFT_1446779 [Phakopsora pachyrhizi]
MSKDNLLDDEDDDFFNDPDFLAEIDQLETQFTSTQNQTNNPSQPTVQQQQQQPHQPNQHLHHQHQHQHQQRETETEGETHPKKRLKSDHRFNQQQDDYQDQSVDYDGPGMFVDQEGNYRFLNNASDRYLSLTKPTLIDQKQHQPIRQQISNNDESLRTSKTTNATKNKTEIRPGLHSYKNQISSSNQRKNHIAQVSNLQQIQPDSGKTSYQNAHQSANHVCENQRPSSTKSPPIPRYSKQSEHQPTQNRKDDYNPQFSDEFKKMQVELERVTEALKQVTGEKNRFKGEVSIVRSSLDSFKTKTYKQINELRQSEEHNRSRADEAEKELKRIRNEKDVNEIFEGLQQSAKRPNSSFRKIPNNSSNRKLVNSSQFSPASKKIQPQLLRFEANSSNLRQNQNEASTIFSDLHKSNNYKKLENQSSSSNFERPQSTHRSKAVTRSKDQLIRTPSKTSYPDQVELLDQPDFSSPIGPPVVIDHLTSQNSNRGIVENNNRTSCSLEKPQSCKDIKVSHQVSI